MIVANTWVGIPVATLILAASLRGIPNELYEAAALDGAGPERKHIFVSVPLIADVIAIFFLLGFVFSVKIFDIVFIMTAGGPANSSNVLGSLAYETAFQSNQWGNSAAISNVMLILSLFLAFGCQVHREAGSLGVMTSVIPSVRTGAVKTPGQYQRAPVLDAEPSYPSPARGREDAFVCPCRGAFLVPGLLDDRLRPEGPEPALLISPRVRPSSNAVGRVPQSLRRVRQRDKELVDHLIDLDVGHLIRGRAGCLCAGQIRSAPALRALGADFADRRSGTANDHVLTPLYEATSRVGLLNNYFTVGVVDPLYGVPFCVLVLRAYMRNIPGTLREAAIVDGASENQVFFRVMLPNSKPGLATIAIFSFLFAWGDFIFGLTFTSGPSVEPASVDLYSLIGSYYSAWFEVMSMVTLLAIPAVIVVILAQRLLQQGVTGFGVER